ncbi:MAG: T9SS type A sorting domain-containing protein [Bacteroidales bacterium]|jgi:hypothetical protein|nr:T9SS type A sorting domain-containing protein [Bacteroidales bacterium]
MKKYIFVVAVSYLGLGFNAKVQAQANLDFSYGDLTNWQCYSGSSNVPDIPCACLLQPELFYIFESVEFDYGCSNIPTIMPGKSYSCRLGLSYNTVAAIEYTLTVNENNARFLLSFALIAEISGHGLVGAPKLEVDFKDTNGNNINALPFNHLEIAAEYLPAGINLICYDANISGINGLNWQTVAFGLESLIGQTIKIKLTSFTCSGHRGYAYVACETQPASIINLCEGQNVAHLSVPTGFSSYQWSRSSDANFNLTTRNINALNPLDSEIFTCVATSPFLYSTTFVSKINKVSIDASFFYDKPEQVHDPLSGNQYDTLLRRATFVDMSKVTNSEKKRIEWSINGLASQIGTSSDSIFTVQFPDPDTPTTYLVNLRVISEIGCEKTSDTLYSNYIRIYPSPKIALAGQQYLCIGNVDTLRGYATKTNMVRYRWHFDPATNANILNDSTLEINQQGVYILEAENEYGCIIYDTQYVSEISIDTTFIFDSVIAGKNYTKYGFNVSDIGTYERIEQNFFGCDSIIILQLAPIEAKITARSDTNGVICSATKGFDAYLWYPNYYNLPAEQCYLIADTAIAIYESYDTAVNWVYMPHAWYNRYGSYYFCKMLIEVPNKKSYIAVYATIDIKDYIKDLSINDIEITHLLIYPNPTTSQLKIKNEQLKEVENVEITDVLGRIQQSSIINQQSEIIIDVSHLPQGMYFIKIGNKRGKFFRN